MLHSNLRYALVVLLTAGCTQDFGAFRGNGGGSSQGGGGQGGQGGSPPMCANDCNDSNPCTQDICDPDGQCLHPAAEDPPLTQVIGDCKIISCDGTEMLDEADTADVPADDNNPCTSEACDGDMPTHPFEPEGTPCNDGVCNATGQCSDCDGADDCGTDTQCATYACNNNTCETTYNVGTVISGDDDGDCMALQCVDGEPDPQDLPFVTDVEDDNNECTDDTCDAGGDPVHTPTPGATCSDGLFCTMTDTCNAAGNCVGSGDPCTGGSECADTCNETNNNCNDPAGTSCGNATNNECTDPDTCNGNGVCQNNNEANGTACGSSANTDCNNPDTCMNGACQANLDPAGTACGDSTNNACTAPDTCDAAGNCLANHAASGTACGSTTNNTCTAPDTCNGSGTCLTNNAANGTPCNDSLPCTMTDTCQGGTCTGTGNPCSGNNTGPSCDDSCNPANGMCTSPDASGTVCNEIAGGATGICDGTNGANNCVGDN